MNSLSLFFKTLPWLGFFAAIVISWIFYLKARNKERLALIEKGFDVSKIYAQAGQQIPFPWLKIGIVITGISLGVLTALILLVLFPLGIVSDAIMFLMAILGFLFGGLAMMIAHFINKAKKTNKNG
ncbi:MAG: hypothetical protein JSV24_02650 [Bacteroidales bacterium]|nr:MAG: hypothetical protein JSV24_02650 [Bacteroidales bacterium]